MKTQAFTFALAACFLGTTALSFGQEPVRTPDQKPARQRRAQEAVGARNALFLAHGDVIGHTVTAKAGEASVDLGTVANFVIDTSNGSISHVVIKAGEKTSQPGQLRAVPASTLNWSAGEDGDSSAVLGLDARAFDATPAFDPKMLDQMAGKSAVDAAAKRLGDAAKDMTDEEKNALNSKAREATAGAVRSVLASNLAGIGVQAPDEEKPFARVGELVVDCTRGRVAFATVAAGEETYLVPFQVLKVQRAPGAEGGKETFSILAPTNAEGMVGAPTINADEKQTIDNPRFRASVNKHYGVKAPMGRRGQRGGQEAGEGADRAGKKRAGGVKERKVRKVRKDGGK